MSNQVEPQALNTLIPATLAIFVRDDEQAYRQDVNEGIGNMKASQATMEDENTRRGRWQHAMKISASVSGAPPALP